MHISIVRSLKTLMAVGILGLAVPATAAVVTDTFNRANSNSLGLTSDATQTWVETEPAADRISIDTDGTNQVAKFNSRGSGTDPGAAVGISVKDLEAKVLMRGWQSASDNYFGGLMYRLGSTSRNFADGLSGYRVMLTGGNWNANSGANSISLYWGGNVFLAGYTHGSAFNNNQEYELKVVANGANHKVYLDGVQVIDFTDADGTRNVAGAAGLGTYYGNYYFRNFEVSDLTVPEPASAMLILPAMAIIGRRRAVR